MKANYSYVLLTCECLENKYLEQAFTMLNINLQKTELSAITRSKASDHANSVIATCCHHLDAITECHELKQAHRIMCVTEQENKQVSTGRVSTLAHPFSIYEFHQALLAIESSHPTESSQMDYLAHELVGVSQAIVNTRQIIKQVANSDSNILILGDSGTGKEVIASCIHHLSDRKKHPFVPLNCGAIPGELMESELFGHEKGAFTGAITKRSGRFEIANHGTLFLDEIGDMPLAMQVKLLRVLQERKIERVGSTSSIDIDVRIIAATNKNLEDMVANNTFREDLYYRLNVIPIYVPTLRERIDDIPLLINNQIAKISKRIPNTAVFTEGSIQLMCQYSWPGNIRELANFIERIVVICHDKVIDESVISEQLHTIKSRSHALPIPTDLNEFNMKEYLSTIEQQIINIALEKTNGIVSAAADYLNLRRTTLIEKIKKYKLITNE